MNIKWLQNTRLTDTGNVGSKAAALGELNSLGISVPSGFVIIVEAFQLFLMNAGLTEVFSSLTSSDSFDRWTRLFKWLVSGIESASWPPALEQQIRDSLRAVEAPFAVRSSGVTEDTRESAFAGAYDSFLNQVTEDDVFNSVRRCWCSAFSQRVEAYRLQHKRLYDNWFMGVIVQTMARADKSGVVFTRNPFAADNSVLLEAVEGGCERIVSGSPADLSVWADRDSHRIIRSESALQPRAMFGTSPASSLVNGGLPNGSILRNREIKLVLEHAMCAERAFGCPLDIEWAFADSRLIFLQARPMTATSLNGDA
jgi:pyruvate,water dikinase